MVKLFISEIIIQVFNNRIAEEEVKNYQAKIIKHRINNQSGVFSVQSSDKMERQCELDQVYLFLQKLLKIKLPAESLQDIRTGLNALGLNGFSIFPELGGLCA